MDARDDRDRLVAASTLTVEETAVESSLRPRTLAEYIGQPQVKGNLAILLAAARQRDEAADHVLLYGPPGLGKTTLANIVAPELGVNLHTTSGPAIERPGDLAAILTNLEERDVLFIDEIHRLPRAVEEILYPAMEDFYIDLMIGEGPAARSLKMPLPRFTLVGATTRAGLLTAPLRARFGIIHRLDFYGNDDLAIIVRQSASILAVTIDDDGALEIASRSRGTPRVANRLLRRVRDYADVRSDGRVTRDVAKAAVESGMPRRDHRLLELAHHVIERMATVRPGRERRIEDVAEHADNVVAHLRIEIAEQRLREQRQPEGEQLQHETGGEHLVPLVRRRRLRIRSGHKLADVAELEEQREAGERREQRQLASRPARRRQGSANEDGTAESRRWAAPAA